MDRGRIRRRLLAVAGLWVLLGGMLAVLGLGNVVLAASAVPLAAVVVAGVGWLVLRSRARRAVRVAVAWVRRIGARLERFAGELRVRARLQRVGAGVAAAGRRGVRRTRTGVAATAARCASSVRRGTPVARCAAAGAAAGARRQARLVDARTRSGYANASARIAALAQDARRAGNRLRGPIPAPKPTRLDRRREALRLNAQGLQLRRAGEYALAAEQHRAALAVVQELGDRRLEALTLNNLALALIHSEGAAAAVAHFEQALAVLRELGDDDHEGRVTANLAFARRREGRADEAEHLLHAALTKLAPDSSAYRRVEEQLRRAS